MRWVCKDDVEENLSQEWRDRAAAALAEVNNATSSSERKDMPYSPHFHLTFHDF